jgi:hypothetical protein
MKQLTQWWHASLPLWVAGKLVVAAPATWAGGGFGKADDNPIPELSLYQSAVPNGLVTVPGQPAETGRIYLKESRSDARLDFLISGIRNDRAMDVYLAFSTRPGKVENWPNSRAGRLTLDPQTLEIIAGVRSSPTQLFLNSATSLGKAQSRTRSVVISLKLSDLNAPQLQSDELYFQAFAVPAQTTDFTESQASELDRYLIVRE